MHQYYAGIFGVHAYPLGSKLLSMTLVFFFAPGKREGDVPSSIPCANYSSATQQILAGGLTLQYDHAQGITLAESFHIGKIRGALYKHSEKHRFTHVRPQGYNHAHAHTIGPPPPPCACPVYVRIILAVLQRGFPKIFIKLFSESLTTTLLLKQH